MKAHNIDSFNPKLLSKVTDTIVDYSKYAFRGDYGHSTDTRNDYNKWRIGYNEEVEKYYNQRYKGTDDPDPSFLDDTLDAHRLFHEKRELTNLSRLQNELREGEGKYIPQIEIAKTYLKLKDERQQLIDDLKVGNEKTQSQTVAQLNRILEIEDELKRIEYGFNYLDEKGNVIGKLEGLRSMARTNPYLTDIFYETDNKKLRTSGTGLFGTNIKDIIKYATVDFLREDKLFSNFDPTDNYKSLLQSDGINLPFIGVTHRLTPQQISAMWDIKNNKTSIENQIKDLEESEHVAKTEYDSKVEDIQKKLHVLQNGNWLFNPNKISKSFRKRQEEGAGTFNPLYMFPEFGTSFAEWQATLGQMGVSMALQYAAKLVGGVSTGGFAPLIIGLTEVAAQAAITNYTRTSETNAEVFDSFTQNVFENLENNDEIKLPQVIDELSINLKNRGFDVDKLDGVEVLLNAVALGLKTSDPKFNQLVNDAEKGLDVVRQTNQALMFSDLAEGMFLFGGKYIKQAFGMRGVKGLLGPATSMKQLNKAATRTMINERLNKEAGGIIDRTIAKAVKKTINDTGKRVAVYNATKNLISLGKKLGFSYLAELNEEGVQHTVSKRYQRGDYDEILSQNAIQGLAEAGLLSVESQLAYHGLHPDENMNGDTELKKAMDIGGMTGLFMSGAFSSPQAYQGIRQALTDRKLREYVATGYGNAEDANKVEQFLSAANRKKTGGYSRIVTNLESLKKFKPEGVTDEMIDEDIRMVNELEMLSNNKALQGTMQRLNVDHKDKEKYAAIMQNAISIGNRLRETQEDSKAATSQLSNLLMEASSNDLMLEFAKQRYREHLKEHKLKRVQRKNEIIANLDDEWVKQRSKKEVDDYINEQLGEDNIVSEQEHTSFVQGMQAMMLELSTLKAILKDISDRIKAFNSMNETLKLDINVHDMRHNLSYIEKQIEDKTDALKKQLGDKFAEGIEEQHGVPLSIRQKLQDTIKAKYLNDAAVSRLMEHLFAYVQGQYDGDMQRYKMYYRNMSEDDQKQVILTLTEFDKANGTHRSVEQIISDHDKQVDESFAKLDEMADKKQANRKRADIVIRHDMYKRVQQNKQLRQEKANEFYQPNDPNNPNNNIDPNNPENPGAMPNTEPPVIKETTVNTTASTELEKAVQELKLEVEGTRLGKQEQIDDDEDPFGSPVIIQEPAKQQSSEPTPEVKPEETNPVPEIKPAEQQVPTTTPVQPNVTPEPVENVVTGTPTEESKPTESSEDSNAEESLPTEEVEVIDTPMPSILESIKDDPFNEDVTTNEVNTPDNVIEVEDTPQPSVTEVLPDPTNVIVVESTETPSASEVQSTPGTENAVYVPEGNTQEAIEINEEFLEQQNAFDEMFDASGRPVGPSEYQLLNLPELKKSKNKFKKLYIGNTFFYNHEATEVMPITVNGKDVQFITKDGKPAVRMPGSELAKKLAIPGWLSTADDVYYVVTSTPLNMSRSVNDFIDIAAIHLIIEKDGIVYNTSLMAIDSKLYEQFRQNGFTEEEKQELIDKLRSLRIKILIAYLGDLYNIKLSEIALKHAKPVGLHISNGSLNSQKKFVPELNAKAPEYRKLTEVEDFGISSDPTEMSRQLADGEIQIGYGTGPYGAWPFTIEDIYTRDQIEINGTGYAGKLFLVPKLEQTPSGKNTLPIMLAEELHRIPGVKTANDVVLAYGSDNKQRYDENGKPIKQSIPELIFRMVIRDEALARTNEPVYNFILGLLANHGENTMTLGFDNTLKLTMNYAIRKQLHMYVNVSYETGKTTFTFVNGYHGENMVVDTPEGRRVKPIYKTLYTDLAGLDDFTMRKLVFQISQNIHWNTDKDILTSPFPQEFIDYVLDEITSGRQSVSSDTDYIYLLNTDELVFSLKDIGYTIKDGKPVKVQDAPLVFSWAVNHGIIKTDLGERAFRAPYVYADDVIVNQDTKDKLDAKAAVPVQEAKPKEVEAVPYDSPYAVEKAPVNEKAPTEPAQTKPLETKLSTPKQAPVMAELATPEVLAKYGLTIPQDGRKESAYLKWAVAKNPKTGEMLVLLAPKKFIIGLTSTTRGKGKLNATQAATWLNEKLGIPRDILLITSGLIEQGDTRKVYGLFQVVMDSLTGELLPLISLSELSGEGVEYHEAFHYVSQLLLTEDQRTQLYQAYVDSKKEHADKTTSEVEELLAEEFRNYTLDRNRSNLKYKVITFFKDLWFTLTTWNKNKRAIRALFKSINNGDFKTQKPKDKVLVEFYSKTHNGLSYYVPGMTTEESDKLTHITDANIFYKIVDSLVNSALTAFDIRTLDDVESLDTNQVFDSLEANMSMGWISEENIGLAEDVLNNRELFRRYIREKLRQLSIVEIDKDDKNKKQGEKEHVEDGDPNETWDKHQATINKKANVSFRAKLFFYSIPKYQYTFIEDEETHEITRRLDPVVDDLFGLPVTESFDEAWTQVMENLWDIDTYQDIVNRSAELGKTIEFFKALYDRLTSEDNPLPDNVKTQLEVTIKSSKVQFDTVNFTHPDVSTRSAGEVKSKEEIEDDIQRSMKIFNVELLDSDALRKTGLLPSRWSQAFFASQAVLRTEDGTPYLNPKIASYIRVKLAQISRYMANATLRKKRGLEVDPELLTNMKTALLEIMNAISIPMDMKSLNYMLDEYYKSNDQYDSFVEFWKGTGFKKNRRFVDGILANFDKLGSKKQGKIISQSKGATTRSLDRMFTFGRNSGSQMKDIVMAYSKKHPSPSEFSVTGADGSLIYPISENNYFSDQTRDLNQNKNGKRQLILNTPYSRRSIIANAKDVKLKLHTFAAFNIDNTSRDYFEITALEDYIAKLAMTVNDRLILPTMSDKKTWYSISGLRTIKEILTPIGDIDGYRYRRFSDEALGIFVNYFLDEYEAVWDYYKKKDYIAKYPHLRVDNYHGEIIDGKMDSTGNGGRFRYFTKLQYGTDTFNLNQELAKLEANGSTEDVFEYLRKVKQVFLNVEHVNEKTTISKNAPIYTAVNHILIKGTESELRAVRKLGIVGYNGSTWFNKLIPSNIMSKYAQLAADRAKDSRSSAGINQEDILFSIIANHVANQAISVIEIEKCYTGDPAYYKWSKTESEHDGFVYQMILNKDVDKIKRLSSVLSTGTNLRTVWDSKEESNPEFTVMHMLDNMIGSVYVDKLRGLFRNQILRDIYSRNNPTKTDSEVIEALNSLAKQDAYYATLSDRDKRFVDEYTSNSVSPYEFKKDKKTGKETGNINQSDGAVYIRPALYKRILKGLGKFDKDTEEAFNLLESDDVSWMYDPEKYQKTMAVAIDILKMVYFGDHADPHTNLNIPVFNKMAIFPLFKALCGADNRVLYDRMNDEKLGVIDMIAFDSAVKVGGRLKVQIYNDPQNNILNEADLSKPTTLLKGIKESTPDNSIPVFIQSLKNLRLQLNTQAHSAKDRSFGTQAVKMCFGNLLEDRVYGENKGTTKTGKQIKDQTIAAINRLSDIGVYYLKSKFFNGDRVNNAELSRYLIQQARTSGMSAEFIKGLTLNDKGEFTTPLASLSSRNWVESRLISMVNKEVVDINTDGGSAIQMSAFGFKATGVRKQSSLGVALNDGKELRFLNEDGSMDVMLSTNFFRNIVPKEYQKSYGMMRKWLLDNGVIDTNAKPMGIGYRIPTQGLSSTFSFKVVDVLPDRFGDTIIVPDGFTSMTGADFDIDKIYIATLNYDENGKILDTNKDISDMNVKELLNLIIQNYQLVISDDKNMAETRASIDTLTDILKKKILPSVRPSNNEEVEPFYELLPSFQENRKQEYSQGKNGIAPFALNSNNHVLTQLTGLTLNLGDNRYNLGNLTATHGRDGYRILDWLSAMINAHVDVAKDPYILSLNVNKATYNITSLLLRAGIGRETFTFLSQPVMKTLAADIMNNEGVYGVNKMTEQELIRDLKLHYSKLFLDRLKTIDNDEVKKEWILKYNAWATLSNMKHIETDDYTDTVAYNYNLAFDPESLQYALDHNSTEDIRTLYQQLVTLQAYTDLTKYAKLLNELVQRSQIDTKKFGNTLVQQMNFMNSYKTFIANNADAFSINGRDDIENPLQYYFENTFLNKKFLNAYNITREILGGQTLPATQGYKNIFSSVMCAIRGVEELVDETGNNIIAYKHTGDKKFIQKIHSYVESIVRARIASDINSLHITDDEFIGMFFGDNTMCVRLNKVKQYILSNREQFKDMVTPDGIITNELLNYLQSYPADMNDVNGIDRIVLSESSMNNNYDRENQLISAFAQLLESTDETIRTFAEDLVKYAYYTSYDERGPNSFFDLIPLDYKKDMGYTQIMNRAVKQLTLGNDVDGYSLVARAGDDPQAMSFPSIRLIIARNMWNDPDIVPNILYNKRVESQNAFNNITEISGTDIELGTSLSTVNGVVYSIPHGIAVSRGRTRGAEFITLTIRNGKNTIQELYQLIGTTAYTDEEGKPINRGMKLVYKRVPKLGYSNGRVRINEFYKSGYEASAFAQNEFSESQMVSDDYLEKMALETAMKSSNMGANMKKFIPNEYHAIEVKTKAAHMQAAGDSTTVVDDPTSFDTAQLGEYNGIVDGFVNLVDPYLDEMDENPFDTVDTGATSNVLSSLLGIKQVEEQATENAEKGGNSLDTLSATTEYESTPGAELDTTPNVDTLFNMLGINQSTETNGQSESNNDQEFDDTAMKKCKS